LPSTAFEAGNPPLLLPALVGRPAARSPPVGGGVLPATGGVGRTAVSASWPLSMRPPSAVIRR
jgi:hypothetical protein